jgi:hypothetical protein
LVTLQTAHHGSTSPRIASTQRNHASRPVSTDFCNKIGTFRTWQVWLTMSVVEGKADFQLRIQTSEFDPKQPSELSTQSQRQVGRIRTLPQNVLIELLVKRGGCREACIDGLRQAIMRDHVQQILHYSPRCGQISIQCQ